MSRSSLKGKLSIDPKGKLPKPANRFIDSKELIRHLGYICKIHIFTLHTSISIYIYIFIYLFIYLFNVFVCVRVPKRALPTHLPLERSNPCGSTFTLESSTSLWPTSPQAKQEERERPKAQKNERKNQGGCWTLPSFAGSVETPKVPGGFSVPCAEPSGFCKWITVSLFAILRIACGCDSQSFSRRRSMRCKVSGVLPMRSRYQSASQAGR